MPAAEHYHIPGAWDPTRSVLGRALARFDSDRLRAETTFYVLAVAAVTGYVVFTFLGWAWINWDGPPTEAEAFRYWILQSAGTSAVLLLAWFGRRRGVNVFVTEQKLRIVARGAPEITIDYSDIEYCERIPGIQYQQHYRLYAETRSFPGRMPERLVLVQTSRFPVILGLRSAEQELFLQQVLSQREARRRETHRVA
ncbi:MAG: hypothetical protein HKN29_15705 [Rhodothermales bacterium]|nr:hypothetical protein [Rhodothermales bacterium]